MQSKRDYDNFRLEFMQIWRRLNWWNRNLVLMRARWLFMKQEIIRWLSNWIYVGKTGRDGKRREP